MDIKELREIGNALSDALDGEGKPLCHIRHQLGRIVSHLESEQSNRLALNRELSVMKQRVDQHDKALFGDRESLDTQPGIVHQCNDIIRAQKRSAKLAMSILTAVLIAIALQVVKLLH